MKTVMPRNVFGYVWSTSRRDQIVLAVLAVLVFLLTMGPLELQRRIVNSALRTGTLADLSILCAAYGAFALLAGAIKLVFNAYRGWINERAVRSLRRLVHEHACESAQTHSVDAAEEGVDIAIVLAEAEPVGSFAGMSFSEPLMQLGTLTTVFAYMIFLQPWMALVSFALFSLQILFVPAMQRAINREAATRIRVLREVGGGMIEGWSSGAGAASERGFHERIDRVFAINMRIYVLKFAMNFLMNLMHHLGVIGVLFIGGGYVIAGEIEIGTVVAFISGLASVNEPWGDLVDYFREAMVAQVKYRLVAGALEVPSDRGARFDLAPVTTPIARS